MSHVLLPMEAPRGRPASEGVRGRVGLAVPTIYELIRKGEFPAPVKLGRSSRWLESEIDAFIEEKVRDRDVFQTWLSGTPKGGRKAKP